MSFRPPRRIAVTCPANSPGAANRAPFCHAAPNQPTSTSAFSHAGYLREAGTNVCSRVEKTFAGAVESSRGHPERLLPEAHAPDRITANVTSSTLLPSHTAGATRAAAPPAAGAPATPEFATTTLGELTWTYDPSFAHVLTTTPAQNWAKPAEQGWQRIKHNARREVWRAVIREKPYYLKYYFCDPVRDFLTRAFRPSACQAEWEGGVFAARAGIPAVRPLAATLRLQRGVRRCALLISEAIEPTQPLSTFWLELQSDDNVARRRQDVAELAEQLAHMIARAHQAGFEHLDMHAANILVQCVGPRRYRTVFVDLQSARRDVPLSGPAVVRNLAQLNQWFRRHSTTGDRFRFLRAYLRWRDEFEHVYEHGRPLGMRFDELATALAAAARRHAHRLGTRRDHRVWRDGRYFARLTLPAGWRGVAMLRCKHATEESRASQMVLQRAWWETQLRNVLRRITPAADAKADNVCKNSHSASVQRALLEHESQSLPVIIKHPRARNLRRTLARLWPPSRSLRAWRIGHALLHRDVPTARPVAVLERRFGPLVLDSLLLTEAIPGAVDLGTFLERAHAERTPTQWVRLKHAITQQLALFVRRLQDRGFYHRDCKASNILVIEHPELKLFWIDMDGIRAAADQPPARRMRALTRLHVSLLDIPGLTRTDRARFLIRYFARFGSAPDAWRAAWPLLDAASQHKTNTLHARRAWKRKHYGRE